MVGNISRKRAVLPATFEEVSFQLEAHYKPDVAARRSPGKS